MAKSVRKVSVNGYGILSPQGSLWPWISGFGKTRAQDEYAALCGQRWALLHKIGYRCVPVEIKTV